MTTLHLSPTDKLAFAGIISQFNISPLNSFVLQNSTSNHLPYHNYYHIQKMVLDCYNGGVYDKLDYKPLRTLVIAALFHDFDHTGGVHDDSENIQRAVTGLIECEEQLRSTNCLSSYEVDAAIQVIKVTQYPYIRDVENSLESIIRDSDMMSIYDWSAQNLVAQFSGLFSEMNITTTSLTPAIFNSQIKPFNDSIKWHTVWAQKRAANGTHNHAVERLVSLLSTHFGRQMG